MNRTATLDKLKAISNPDRFHIMEILSRRKRFTPHSDLANSLNLAQSNLSHHLGRLTNSGWIEDKKVGRHMFYRMSDKSHFRSTKKMLEIG
ncbi:unnamed protein product [marine sediment metagenome]|uniref:HTH arsR-type domain-containing protein n=1 Tax=marine sediment metagenome TaxID=412755 RepID=X0XRN0_9ZZZZ